MGGGLYLCNNKCNEPSCFLHSYLLMRLTSRLFDLIMIGSKQEQLMLPQTGSITQSLNLGSFYCSCQSLLSLCSLIQMAVLNLKKVGSPGM